MSNIKIDYLFITKSEIARILNLSPQYISMILSGKRKAPKVRAMIASIINQKLKAA